MTLAVAQPAAAQDGASDSRVLKGRVIDAEDVPIDQLGRPITDGLPGFVPANEVPQAVRDELAPLEKERDRIVNSAREARAAKDPSRLPSDAGAPPPIDSGDDDPDRLLPSSQPPKPSFPEF